MIDSFFPFSATTGPVTVRVSVSYLPEQSHPTLGRWFWAYHVRIENHGDTAVQLISRHWRIVDGRGQLSEVEGEGVVGEQPLIGPGEAFDYVSGCPLPTPEGSMVGSYMIESGNGTQMLVAIPHFPLVAPATAS
ncbi:Co2+/Mg2+ efflux protein ApaG [Sphingopyxis sp. XHP0097]|uniref:Protein ApaG n=1 Tax=Sphingopyxis jiangsuensis TaxID=2871171 RepID=A0ABS7MCN9_9SPHN|nr:MULTISPECIES: Co2+/Mg2+ efflux protein ApaG [Sphingopyxis]MBL0767537.1 Co2+/Mg2+ efflux protein ApaG [Sphingopyxis lutea]MBY4636795.1 Co2+/Mg2+ efflux protein ApaG [Sphingopyxis jiangsuensis]